MERINTESKSVDLFGAGKHGYKDPNGNGIGGTRVDRAALNALQEELASVVEASGQTLAPGNAYTQLLGALRMQDVAQALGLLASSDAVTAGGGAPVHAVAWGRPDAGSQLTATLAVGGNGLLLVTEDGGLDYAALTAADSFADDFLAVTYIDEDNGFLACGESGVIQKIRTTSYTVTEVEDGTAAVFSGIAYSPTLERVVVVAQALVGVATIRTAELADLTTWTGRTAGSSYAGDFKAVTWDAIRALFIAVGSGGEVQTSADGITWTRRNTDAGGTLTAVATNALGCVAVRVASGATTEVLRSADALTWAVVDVNTTPSGTERVGGEVISVNGVFLAPERLQGVRGVYMSADGGVSWKMRYQPQFRIFTTTSSGHLLYDGRRMHLADGAGHDQISAIPAAVL